LWLHASPTFIADGDYILSPKDSGYPPRWASDEPTVRWAEDKNLYRRDRVCIFDSEGASAQDHIGRFSFVTPESYIYEVQPIGALEDDPDLPGHFSWRCCPRARVLSCLHHPISAVRATRPDKRC
jgi:hypothetical protein